MSDYMLFVEDNPRDVEITLDLLHQAGNRWEVIVLNDGESAMAFLERRGEFSSRREGFPRVILLDIKMPRISGLEVLRAIRDNPALGGAAHFIAAGAGHPRRVRAESRRVRHQATKAGTARRHG